MNGPPWNVLVFAGGTELGLEVQAALRERKEVHLFSAGMPGPGHAPYVFHHHAELPSVHEPGWRAPFEALLAQHNIDAVFPGHDDVLLALARIAEEIPAAIITSPLETCEITRSKARTYECLADAVYCPTVYAGLETVDTYPVFVKPDVGQGSQGARVVRSRVALEAALEDRDGLLILENLPGEEVTVDCFSDREQGLLFCQGRSRTRVRNGISVTSLPAHEPQFDELAHAIGKRLPLHGAWFFQLKRASDGTWTLLEVAPRVGGTSGLARAMGVNLPLLSLYEAARMPVSVEHFEGVLEVDRALVSRFRLDLEFDTVYVDLDDTLIVHGKVHSRLVRFLYDCLNAGRRLALITRHDRDPEVTLAERRLSGLFDEIIHLQKGESKADHIVGPRAIFIDDSFGERRAVREGAGVPAFDCSQLEALLDARS